MSRACWRGWARCAAICAGRAAGARSARQRTRCSRQRRRQCPPQARQAETRRLEPGHDGARRDGLHAARAALRRVPRGPLVPRAPWASPSAALARAQDRSRCGSTLRPRRCCSTRAGAPCWCAQESGRQRTLLAPVAVPRRRNAPVDAAVRSEPGARQAGRLSAIRLWHSRRARSHCARRATPSPFATSGLAPFLVRVASCRDQSR